MQRIGSGVLAAVLLPALALGDSVGLAAGTSKTALKVAPTPHPTARMRPKVPQFPADVKALGDRLWSTASPAVKTWSNQNAQAIAKGSADPEALARTAVQSRWSHIRNVGASDTLAFIATYDAAKSLQETVDRAKQDLDSKSEMGETESLRLQMAMDRLSKMMSTLSNLLKKNSATAQSITQNLK